MKIDLPPKIEAELARAKMTWAAKLAAKIAYQHDLAYRTRVNLEATLNTMLHYGLSKKKAKDLIEDLFENIYFVNMAPMLPHFDLKRLRRKK